MPAHDCKIISDEKESMCVWEKTVNWILLIFVILAIIAFATRTDIKSFKKSLFFNEAIKWTLVYLFWYFCWPVLRHCGRWVGGRTGVISAVDGMPLRQRNCEPNQADLWMDYWFMTMLALFVFYAIFALEF